MNRHTFGSLTRRVLSAALLLVAAALPLPARAAQDSAPPAAQDSTPRWTEVSSFLASGQPTGPMGLPDTPAGHRAAWLVDFLNHGFAGIESPWPQVFAEGLLDQLPLTTVDEWAAERRAGWGRLMPLRWITGEDQNGRSTDAVLFVILQGEADGSGWRLSLAVQPEEPHHVGAWQLDPDLAGARERTYGSPQAIRSDLDRTGLDYGLTLLDVTDHNPADEGPAVPVLSINGDRLLNVSVAIRWIVLATLAEQVHAGMIDWNEPVTLSGPLYSMPPGDVRRVPPGEQLPVSTLAVSMIASADNTATDHLIELVGRSTIDAFLSSRLANPDANRPFLNTMQMFRLKVGQSEDPIAAYAAAASVDERLRILNELVPGNEVHQAMYERWAVPQYLHRVGWFMSANELARIMAELWHRGHEPSLYFIDPILRTNIESPLPENRSWEKVAVRPEGEPGVVTLYALLDHRDGRRFLMVLIANNPVESVNTVMLSPILDGMLNYIGTLAPAQYPAALPPAPAGTP